MVNEYGWKWYHRGCKPQWLYYEPHGAILRATGALLGATWAVLWARGPSKPTSEIYKKSAPFCICFTVESGASWTRTHARAPRRRLFTVKHSEMKKSNSKSTIKAIEKKRDFHTSHAECPLLIGPGTGGEEETLYIRSSMEEDRAYW